jgi:hypothetical protein
MNRICRFTVLGIGVVLLLVPGCATVMNGRHAEVAIKSKPAGARVSVQNEKGETVATSKTPGTVTLKRSHGLFRKAPRYTAFIEKPGYETAQVSINPKWNPWILGNVVLGGVIGLAADSATGAIWRYSPDDINQPLSPISDEYYSDNTAPGVSTVDYESEPSPDVVVSE